jgi:hypothetical protein
MDCGQPCGGTLLACHRARGHLYKQTQARPLSPSRYPHYSTILSFHHPDLRAWDVGQMRQTNPISPPGGRGWGYDRAKQSQFARRGRARQGPGDGGREVLYKQSQFPTPGQAGGIPAGAKRAKQSQFGTSWARTPNPRGGDYAKQSRTWEDWGTWARTVIVCGSASPESGTCKTNPISRSRPAGGVLSIPLFYHSTIPIRCRLCKTNPIPSGQAEAMDVDSATTRLPHTYGSLPVRFRCQNRGGFIPCGGNEQWLAQ